MGNEFVNNQTLDYWKQVNEKTPEYENVASLGSWNEADKLDETDDD